MRNIEGTNEKIKSYLFSIPNGGSRNLLEAYNLKLQGLTSGVPDLLFAYPNKNYHGLWIELKSRKGIISKNQAIVIERLRHVGYLVLICHSVDEAIEGINKYLNG